MNSGQSIVNSHKVWKIKLMRLSGMTREFLNLQEKEQRTGFSKESAIP
jgi:hypothetical protein